MKVKRFSLWLRNVILVGMAFVFFSFFFFFMHPIAKYVFKFATNVYVYLSFPKIYDEYLSLKNKQYQLDFYKHYVSVLQEENKELRSLLNMPSIIGFKKRVADVIYSPSRKASVFYINLGKKDGIDVGYGVVLMGMVVCGRIERVWDHMSRVAMLNKAGFSIASVDDTARIEGIISSGSPVRFEFVDKQEMLNVSDVIRVSKLSRYFPEGYLIGEVSSYECSEGKEECWAEIDPCIKEIGFSKVLVLIPEISIPE